MMSGGRPPIPKKQLVERSLNLQGFVAVEGPSARAWRVPP